MPWRDFFQTSQGPASHQPYHAAHQRRAQHTRAAQRVQDVAVLAEQFFAAKHTARNRRAQEAFQRRQIISKSGIGAGGAALKCLEQLTEAEGKIA